MIPFLRTLNGLGDCLYARPFVKDMRAKIKGDIALRTGFPQMFEDISGLRLVRMQSGLPYVMKSIREWGVDREWRGAPKDEDGNKREPELLGYDPTSTNNVIRQMERQWSLRRLDFDLPNQGESPILGRYAIIRPVVLRKEFPITARNCLPEYIDTACGMLKKEGVLTVSIANLGDEVLEGGRTCNADVEFLHGELTIRQMIALFASASAVVSPPGFAMPMAIAARKPLLAAIWGARGGLDHPGRIFEPRMGLSRVTNFSPSMTCIHSTDACGCEKYISDFYTRMENFVAQVASTC